MLTPVCHPGLENYSPRLTELIHRHGGNSGPRRVGNLGGFYLSEIPSQWGSGGAGNCHWDYNNHYFLPNRCADYFCLCFSGAWLCSNENEAALFHNLKFLGFCDCGMRASFLTTVKSKRGSVELGRWWHTPRIPALGRQRQVNLREDEARLVCRAPTPFLFLLLPHPFLFFFFFPLTVICNE